MLFYTIPCICKETKKIQFRQIFFLNFSLSQIASKWFVRQLLQLSFFHRHAVEIDINANILFSFVELLKYWVRFEY